MSTIKLDSIAIDCPDAEALSTFYGHLLDLPVKFDAVRVPDRDLEIWFQPVDDYLPPTWPTQERGQQIHLDYAVTDLSAGVARAITLGATKADVQPGDSWTVMLDPAGHPFCLFAQDTGLADDTPRIASIVFDAPNESALATFYAGLLHGEAEANDGWASVIAETPVTVGVQPVEGYLATTWPTQERGQQIHIDYHATDRAAEVARAETLGATLVDVNESFTVMKDPAGHTFCICDIS